LIAMEPASLDAALLLDLSLDLLNLPAALLDLPLEVLAEVCQQLDLHDLARVAKTCKRFRHGEGGLETVKLPTKSPVVAALSKLAFADGAVIPSTRPAACSESWIAYLARCVRQRRSREAPPIAAGTEYLLVDAAGQLLVCRDGNAADHAGANVVSSAPTPVAAMPSVRVRSVAAGPQHSLALGWDGRVYSWGANGLGQLGLGDKLGRPAPTLVEGLEEVREVAAGAFHSLAVTQSGDVFIWGAPILQRATLHLIILDAPNAPACSLRPTILDGFGGVRMRHVSASDGKMIAIGEAGELFSWGGGPHGLFGHGDEEDQPSPKRVEALRGIAVSSLSVGACHALALTEDGLVYTWGDNPERALLGNPSVEKELLPKPAEALGGVRVSSVAAAGKHSYAVADTSELWAWGVDSTDAPLGHGEQVPCPLPKPIESLRGVKVNAVAACHGRTMALADDGSVYASGVARRIAIFLPLSMNDATPGVRTPQRLSLSSSHVANEP
jgi:alpha-tubulin suppressor-like RCC1 family protein